jgi:pSer/pThr/pTyr-binding forkhead associated (FHA) protein
MRGLGIALATALPILLFAVPAAAQLQSGGGETVSIKSPELLPSNPWPGSEERQLRANPPEARADGLGGGIPAGPSSASGAAPAPRAALSPREAAPRPVPPASSAPAPPERAAPPRLEADPLGWMLRGLLALAALPLALWVLHRPRRVNTVAGPGFEVITPSELRQFIPLEDKVTQLDFVSRIQTLGALRLSANLNKVGLSNRRYGYLLEDKNFRNALLVNRRRMRRTLLKDGDVLDLGDLTLLYRDNRNGGIGRQAPAPPPEGKAVIKFDRVRGPIRRGTPILTSETQPNRVFFLSKNLVFIGRSEDNDLVIRSPDVQSRHAKIERVGSRYKLQDLSMTGNTFVNNRRVEQRYLREGDEIAIDVHRFKFGVVTKPLRERPAASEPVVEEGLSGQEEAAAAEAVAAPATGAAEAPQEAPAGPGRSS